MTQHATRNGKTHSALGARRYALGARRTALRACVPGGTAAGCHRRLALRAQRRDGVGAARPGAYTRQPGRGLALRARHQRRRRCTPERPHVLPRLRTCRIKRQRVQDKHARTLTPSTRTPLTRTRHGSRQRHSGRPPSWLQPSRSALPSFAPPLAPQAHVPVSVGPYSHPGCARS